MPTVIFDARCMAAMAVLVLLAPGPGQAEAAGAASLVNHQAIYELRLKTSRRSPSVDSAQGRIVYGFAGTACEGYTTDFRQVLQIASGDGKQTLSDMRSTSWEEPDAKSYRFRIETRTNEGAPAVVEGTAARSDRGVTVTLKQPQARTVTFEPDIVFPTEQVRRILAAARDGKSLLQLNVFDGSDTGQKLYSTLTVIGQPIPGGRAPEPADAAAAALKEVVRWPVTVSYYDRAASSKSGEQIPVYSMSFELYENGVSRALTLDYNDFVVSGAMSRYDGKDAKPCNK